MKNIIKYWDLTLLIGAIFFLFYYSLLAIGPQNPDAGELLLTAQYGGVLHPPGFPIQSWVNLFWEMVLPFSTHQNLLIGNLFFHFLNCLLLVLIFQLYHFSKISQKLLIIQYSLFPLAWSMAMQVEKYTLLVTLLLLPIYFWKRWLEDHNENNLIFFACCWSLTIGHHYFGFALWPFYLQFLFSKRIKIKTKISSIIILCILISLAYFSLFLLTRPSLYPDWGKLSSFQDLINHLLRKGVTIDKKLFTFFDHNKISAFYYVRESLAAYYYLPLASILLGCYQLVKHQKRDIALFIFMLFSILTLSFFNYHPTSANQYWPSYLRRYGVIALPWLILLMGIGFNTIKKYHFTTSLLYSLFLLICATNLRPLMDMSTPSTIELYRNSLSKLIPANAFYLGSSDEQILYGVPAGKENRFPIRSSNESWYTERVIPLLEPRLSPRDGGKVPERIHLPSLAKMLTENAALVATTSPHILSNKSHRYGLVWFNQKLALDDRTVNQTLCHEVLKINRPLNKSYHEYQWFIAKKFQEAIHQNCRKEYGKALCPKKELTPAFFKASCQQLLN